MDSPETARSDQRDVTQADVKVLVLDDIELTDNTSKEMELTPTSPLKDYIYSETDHDLSGTLLHQNDYFKKKIKTREKGTSAESSASSSICDITFHSDTLLMDSQSILGTVSKEMQPRQFEENVLVYSRYVSDTKNSSSSSSSSKQSDLLPIVVMSETTQSEQESFKSKLPDMCSSLIRELMCDRSNTDDDGEADICSQSYQTGDSNSQSDEVITKEVSITPSNKQLLRSKSSESVSTAGGDILKFPFYRLSSVESNKSSKNLRECPVTQEEVMSKTKKSELEELATKFDPPVCMHHVTGKEDMRRRLLLAIRQAEGRMKDIDTLEKIFLESQLQDDEKRKKLCDLFKDFQQTLKDMDEGLPLLHLPEETIAVIGAHQRMLEQRGCPIIVAGEVSSGKSTLLNLFLGDSKLPVSTLSCTGRICELSYAESPHAVLVTTKGEQKEIKLDELEECINMQGKDESFNKFDVVRLFLPIPFLKSGITLIDTPGIGQDMEDSSIVKAYVKDHEVFGFIFTIHSAAAGGVNQKFRNLLQTLAGDDYVDKNGHRKLDPHSVIFVCNFWDSVPEDEKETTKQYIMDTINNMPFMNGFDPDQQLFFLDSKKAYFTWKAGYITEDYDRLIEGIKTFFNVGQTKKIKQSYVWIENLIQRSLHSLRSFLCWAQQQRVLAVTFKDALIVELEYLRETSKKQLKTFCGLIECNAQRLGGILLEFLQSKETQTKFERWLPEHIVGVHKYNNVKEIFEYKLDELIDERIAEVLLDWETNYRYITMLQGQLAEGIHLTFEILNRELDRFERELRCTDSTDSVNSDCKYKTGADRDLDEVTTFVHAISPTGKEDFGVAYSTTHGNKIMSGKGITMRFRKLFGRRKHSFQIPNRYSETYTSDLLRHMRCRSLAVVNNMCSSEHTELIINQQFTPVLTFFEDKNKNFKNRLNQNVALVENLTRNVDFIVGNNKWYEENTGKLKSLFDTLLAYNHQYITTPEHRDSELLSHDGEYNWLQAGLYGSIELTRFKGTGKPITVKTLYDPACKAMRESDIFTLIKTLKSVKKLSFVPQYLGSCYSSSALVFAGHLPTARHFLLSKTSDVGRTMYQRIVVNFLQELAQALQFIHMEKLVHIELSLDSVLVKQNQSSIFPVLSSLSEKRQMEFPDETTGVRVGNFLYLPPEVLEEASTERMNRWYRTPADMYGLGLIMVELWYQKQDIFLERKQDSLKEWMAIDDPGRVLFDEAVRVGRRHTPFEWMELIKMCLLKDVHERISAKNYLKQIITITEMNQAVSPVSRKRSNQPKSDSIVMAATPVPIKNPTRPHSLPSDIEQSIAPHLQHNTTHIPRKEVKRLALRSSGDSIESHELQEFFSSTKVDAALSPIDFYEEVFSLSMLLNSAPDYALYTTGVTLRAMQDTLASNNENKEYSVKDIADILGTCSPKHPTRPIYGIDDALRLGQLKDRVLWSELPQVRKSGVMKSMSDDEIKLQEAIFEVVSSEASYMKSLQYLATEIMFTLENKYLITRTSNDGIRLYSNIKKIEESNTRLFCNFEDLWGEDHIIQPKDICEILTDFFNSQETRERYVIYFSNHMYQHEKLKNIKDRFYLTDFVHFVDKIGDNRLSLIDGYLSLPIQRIPRYKILIEAMIRHASAEDMKGGVGEIMEKCLDSIMMLCEVCDGAVRRMQDMEYMTKLDSRMDFAQLRKYPVVSESHESIKDGEITRIAPRSAFWAWSWTERWHIHLFTDVIFFTRKSGDRLIVQDYCDPKKVHASHMVKEVANLRMDGGLPAGCTNILHIAFIDKDYAGLHQELFFHCRDESDLVRWVECISPPMSQPNPKYGQIDYLTPADSPMVIVMRSFTAVNPDEISLFEGEIIRIKRRIEFSDWCEGEKIESAEIGWFPRSHTKEIDCLYKRRKILMSQQRLFQVTKKIYETRGPKILGYKIGDLEKLTHDMILKLME